MNSFKCVKCGKPSVVLTGTESWHCGSCGFEEHGADEADLESLNKFTLNLIKKLKGQCCYCGKKMKKVKPYLWQCVNKKCEDGKKISLSVG